jgi:hypothetical protein
MRGKRSVQDPADGDPALLHRGASQSRRCAARHLRSAEEFAVDAAFAEQCLGTGFLTVARPDSGQRNVHGDAQHPNVVRYASQSEPFDQGADSRAATTHAHRKLTVSAASSRDHERRIL